MKDALGNPQTALLLGGGSDIGLATMRAMVGRRLRQIVLAGRDTAALQPAAGELRTLGATDVEVTAFDALDTAGHDDLVAGVFERHGDIDLALVAFGVLGDQEEAEASAVEAARVVATNYVGAVTTCLALARHMRVQGHGTIVVLSSVAAERARRSNFVYGSSKAGLDAFAQGLADALRGSGVEIVIVRPGFVRSSMTEGLDPAPMATTPESVADAIVGAVGGGSRVIHVPGILRWVFTLLRHLPGPVFRRLPL
ncbi:MAG TPA: decaprenylphospho-beta-D-erythro-pentofuranosid-2-ulose 2-reductase [Acidimicrobiales bacterium]|nr:decaprenylphospho-beta-D-erythro-pentofuranosid-2-ulose 2-reductase [Acidimicrobiales bacterium]